uniref:Cadherin domain-containing protein n=1 Tax=Romanomermis culicivorax TaxID=13658 RepID=A0A915HH22_ROMCU
MERWAIISLIFWPPAIFCRTEELNTETSHDCYQPILNLHYLHCRIDRVNINDSDIRFWNDSLYFVDGRCSKKFYVIDISAIYRCDLRSTFVRSLRIRLQNENRRISKRFASPTITLKSAGLYFEQNEYRTSVTEEDSNNLLYSELIQICRRPLDRETISEHVFRVTAYELTKNDQFFSSSLNFENDQSASTQLVIRVLDVNDHLPIFDKSVYVGSISESVEIGTTVLHVHARDEDEDFNGKIDYSIDEDEADQNFSDFQLDLETDPAHANNCGSALVEITVEDENDNYPQFSHVTNVDIDENLDSTVRPLIAKISAYDPDLGDNGRIHYSIVSGNGHNKFSLDYKTGEIRLIDKLNHKQTPRYELLIRAQDSGLVPLSNMTLLIINVKDVNDNPPKFYSSFIQETIPEDATLGFSVVRIQAYDSDSGENSRVSYSIHGIIDDEDGPSFLENLPFKIDSTSGWISVVGLLDREKRNSYDFRVKAKDHGTPELFSFIKVNIQVADVNDNPPVFDEKFYNVSVPESAQKGSEILKVTAKDKDETAGRLDYFIISGNDDETFMLLNQADGGLLTVNKKLDYRIQPSYVLSLRVADTGGFFDICQVYVEILDVNSPPYFSEYHLYPIVVSEQEPINSTVAVIRAEDSDDGENARLLYKMDGHRGGHFRIDGVSGAIMINRKLDRETISKYNLIITVLDNGKPPLSTSTELEIVIDDFNDNYPIFQKPNYTVSIPEDLPIGTSFLQVSANDNDSGQNGRLSYAILTAENDGKDFYVDPSSGVLRVNKSLDREKVAEYNLTLIASDKGSPPLTSSTIVRILLDDINDNAPKFDKDVYDILVPENSLLESKIFTLKAHDPDYGKNAQITFKIFGGSDAASFELVADTVDPNSVDILLKTDLDYESSKKFYNFQVKADSGDLNSIVDIRIFVTDVNDHAPILNDFRFIFNNYPGRFRLASSARVPAKDLDVNDTLRFWIADQENETARKFDPFGVKSLLDVDQFTGIITLKSNLNTNRDVFGNIVVCVSDGANKRCATCQLKVTLITEEILISSVTVRLSGHTVSSFLDAYIYGRFLDALSTLLPSSVDDIIVFSV